VGPPAARFYLAHRPRLFPDAPVVIAALDERVARGAPLRPNDAAVLGKVDLPRLFDNVLRLLPETRTIAVVIGASELERFWLGELKRELEPLASRVNFIYLNDLSLEQMQQRVAGLPPHSAIFYGLLVVDAAGVPHERQDALLRLHAAANAPIFGIYEDELGKGVVGGPYTSQWRAGREIAAVALSTLAGTAGPAPRISVAPFEAPVYDWRELQRWGIDRARLPPGSEIRFRTPSTWEQHWVAIVAAIAVVVLQSALIAVLLQQRVRLRRTEQEARGLGGRLITAHEDERRRIARELHDDLTQRLAGLAIEAASVEGSAGSAAGRAAAHAIRQGLTDVSEDVHAMSYRLHPSVIEDLGLVEALRTECDRVSRNEGIDVEFDSGGVPDSLPPDVALCLFRVAQEALHNVSRHASASSVKVSLRRDDGELALAVRDDGCGFDASREGGRASLGLASMRERARLLGGKLRVESAPGRGTTVRAWVPVKEAA